MSTSKGRYTFHVDYPPVPTPRARARVGGRGYYEGGRYGAWRDFVKAAALNALGGARLRHQGAVMLEVGFAQAGADVAVTVYDDAARGRADLDNLAKGVMDALQDVMYVDDRQVMVLWVNKEGMS